MLLAGLDIETTGLEQKHGHRLIQVGISVFDTDTGQTADYSSDVCPIGKVVYDDYAMKVNGFTKKRIKAAPSQDKADTILWQNMLRDGWKINTLIPVGFNVIMFDMPFIKKELCLLSTMFTYPSPECSTRAIDLMSLGLLLEHKTGQPYASIKADVRKYVEAAMGYEKHHDALYDAKAALLSLTYFRDKIGEI